MQIEQYLIIKKTGVWSYTSRMAKNNPALSPNEIAIKVALELPDAIFDKPAFEANIVVPEEAVSQPIIEAEVVDNVEEIIKQNTGFEVKLKVVTPEDEGNK